MLLSLLSSLLLDRMSPGFHAEGKGVDHNASVQTEFGMRSSTMLSMEKSKSTFLLLCLFPINFSSQTTEPFSSSMETLKGSGPVGFADDASAEAVVLENLRRMFDYKHREVRR